MTRHTLEPIRNLSLSMTNEPLSQLVHQWQRGSLDPNPPYQRGQVWTLSQQVALVGSLMTGTPIPAIITNRRGSGMAKTRYVIDGLQRITAFRKFLEGELLVPASWFPAEEVLAPVELSANPDLKTLYEDDGLYVSFDCLAEVAQIVLENYTVPVATGRFRTVREEAAVYLRVNGYGTPQADEDMERALRVAGGAA
jgi:hypothetical protein